MEEIKNVPVQEPENTVKPKKKLFGKPEIFMLIVLIFGNGIAALLSWISSFIIALMSGPSDFLPNFIRDILVTLISNISNYASLLLPVAVIILFAYLAYKNLRKAVRFVGVAFVATKIAAIIYMLMTAIPSLISTIFYESEVVTFILAIAGILMDICEIFISAVIGVILLMVVEGKIRFKKKAKPETVEAKEAE